MARAKLHFAGYPAAYVYDQPTGTVTKPEGTVIEHLLWGQYVGVFSGPGTRTNGFHKVVIRGGRKGWMTPGSFQKERILEVVFVDIGQGDGCLLVTPHDEHFVIDAGVGDNMYRFLRWRYNFANQTQPVPFKGVISHPDSDHYAGFGYFFDDPMVHFTTIYQNGLMERRGSKALSLGPKSRSGRRSYVRELVRDRADLDRFLNGNLWRASQPRYNKQYPAMLEKGRQNGSFSAFEMLDMQTNGGWLPGYGRNKQPSIQILGPVTEKIPGQSKRCLRWLGNAGYTKNGHSVVFKVRYHDVTLLLGGDLNIPSEELLLSHHTGGGKLPREGDSSYKAFIDKARQTFQVDVAKSCHHGSADFFRPYLEATYPLVTVISSGDEESHSHPRADTLGTVGKYSRGTRSLLFNTELARSSGERIEIPPKIRRSLDDLAVEIAGLEARLEEGRNALTVSEREEIEEEIDSLRKRQDRKWEQLARSVDVYGAINLRTDGKRIVMAQKLERKRGSDEWDIYKLEQDSGGDFRYLSKYEK